MSPGTGQFPAAVDPQPLLRFIGALLLACTIAWQLAPSNQWLGYLSPATSLLIVLFLQPAYRDWWRYGLIAIATLALASPLSPRPWGMLLVECPLVLAQALCTAWWARTLLAADGTVTLSIWLKIFSVLAFAINPVAALGAAGLYYAVGYSNWQELWREWLLRDTISASVFFTYLLLFRASDLRELLQPRQLRYWLATALLLTGYAYLAFRNFTNPFIALALPFTLIALYFSVSQTGIMTWVVIAAIWTLHVAGWLQPAADIFRTSEPAAALLMSITFIFPAIVGVAMQEARMREEKILGLSERLNLATTSNGLGVWEWDLLQDRLIWDWQMHRLYDSMDFEDEHAPRHWRERVDPVDLPKLEQTLARARGGEKITGIDFAVRTRRGGERILRMTAAPIKNSAGQVIKLVGINSDITDSYFADLLLAEKNRIVELTQKEFALLFDMAPGPLLMVNTQGKIKKANSAAHQLFQYPALAEEKIDRLLPQNPLRELLDHHQLGMVLPANEYRREVLALTRQQHSMTVELRQRIFTLNDEHYVIISVRDLTEQKQAEAAISAAQQSAERANAAKSEFIANMSHEIRTPLNAVLGTVKLLQHTELTDLQFNYLNMIHNAGESLLSILNDILDISKIEAGRMELSPVLFNMEDVLTRLSAIMAINAGRKDLDLVIHVDRDLGRLFFGDPQRLQQVLVNLVSNAIKFTERGHIHLQLRRLGGSAGQATLEFRVRDSGIGIAPEKQERLFTAFSQADNSVTRRFGGTGLGLLISKRLVEMMGGSIGLQSSEGVGSEFTFSVSLLQAPDDAIPAEQRPMVVLLVEPAVAVAAAVAEYLHSWHWPCDTANDVAAARSQLERTPGKIYDCVICSHAVDMIDRSDFFSDLRIRNPQTALVVLGRAMAREPLNDQLRQRLFDGVLIQPVTRTQLSSVLLEASARASGLDLQIQTQPQTSPPYLHGLRLLLVEDNPLNQMVARGLLEQYGARVDVAGDGQQAVALLQQQPELYQVILMDVQMPVLDGFSATRVIREELAIETPILAMSAGVMASEKNRCLQAGMADFVAKPIQVEAMLNAILGVVGRPRLGTHSLPAAPDTTVDNRVFNPETLLRHVKGNTQRYTAIVQMIRTAVERGTQPLDEAIAALRDGNNEQARRIFHTLKGSMGNLGAVKIWEIAHRLEVATQEIPPPTEIGLLFEEMRQAINEMLPMAQLWLDKQNGAPAQHMENLNPVDWQHSLEQLVALLAQNDMHAFDVYEKLRFNLSQQLAPDAYTQLDQAVQNMRFAQAEHLLRESLVTRAGTAR